MITGLLLIITPYTHPHITHLPIKFELLDIHTLTKGSQSLLSPHPPPSHPHTHITYLSIKFELLDEYLQHVDEGFTVTP